MKHGEKEEEKTQIPLLEHESNLHPSIQNLL